MTADKVMAALQALAALTPDELTKLLDTIQGPLLTAEQVAKELNVTRNTVTIWCSKGLLSGARKVGVGDRVTWQIPEESLVGFEPPKRGWAGHWEKVKREK